MVVIEQAYITEYFELTMPRKGDRFRYISRSESEGSQSQPKSVDAAFLVHHIEEECQDVTNMLTLIK